MILRDQPWDERLAPGWVRGLRRVGGAARGRRPADLRRAVAQGRRPAPATGRSARTTTGATTPGCPGSRSRAPRRSGSAGSTCARDGPAQPDPAPGGVALRRRAADRTRGRRPLRPRRRAARPHRRRPRAAHGWWRAPTSARRRTALRGPRTRRRSCCASSAGCAVPARSTRSRRPWSAPATASSPSARSSTRSAGLLEQDAAELRAAYLPVVRELVTEGFLELGSVSGPKTGSLIRTPGP